MRLYGIFLTVVLTVAISAPALAESAPELAVESRVARVTVFPSQARVQREASVSLATGETTLVFPDLPASIDRDSVSISATGRDLLLGPVEIEKVTKSEYAAQEQALRDKIQSLDDRLRAASDAAKAAQLQYEFIVRLGQTATTLIDKEMAQAQVDPTRWEAAWRKVGAGAEESLQKTQQSEQTKRELNKERLVLQAELDKIRTDRKDHLTVRAAVTAGATGNATVRLAYQIPQARWWPTYEARLDSNTDRVALKRLAWVQQRTGEDWTAVTLTLSTAQPSRNTVVPELYPRVVRLRSGGVMPKTLSSRSFDSTGSVDALREKAEVFAYGDHPVPAAEPAAPARTRAAAVTFGDFATQFELPGSVSVPADNRAHQYTVGTEDLEVSLKAVTVPRRGNHAYLLAAGTQPGPAPILAGDANLFWGDAFVGKTTLPLLRAGEEFELSFGIDDAIKVEFVQEPEKEGDSGIFGAKRRRDFRHKVTVANHHERALSIAVRDHLPVPADDDIEVQRMRDSTPPTTEDLDDKKGVVEWERSHKAGEERQIRIYYRVSWPAKFEVTGL